MHPKAPESGGSIANGLNPADIERIECETAEGIVHRLWEPLANKQHPPNGYAAKFSIPYAIAVGMLRDDAGLGEYQETVVRDPENPYLKRDLSVSYGKLGDLELRAGNPGAARDPYDEALKIADELAKADPGNLEWQRDLSVGYSRLGDLELASRGPPDLARAEQGRPLSAAYAVVSFSSPDASRPLAMSIFSALYLSGAAFASAIACA